MNNNLFSHKHNFKKFGMAIIVIVMMVTVLYNLKLQSVTKYKEQQQSMIDEYNLNSEQQNKNGSTDSETTENGSKEVNTDSLISQSDNSINDTVENPSTNQSSINNLSNDDTLGNSTINDNSDNNLGVVKTTDSSIISAENNTSSSDIENVTCYIEIRCDAISSNMSKWTNTKKDKKIIPEDGVIIANMEINVPDKSTVLDVLKKVTVMNSISLDATSQGYIKSINQLQEMDAGRTSGWLYWVNNVSPSVTCSSYIVKNGDKIKWQYTCDYGNEFDKNGNLK